MRCWIRGYTLIELLVSLTIVWLLAGVVYPLVGAARGKAYEARCISNLKQIGTAMDMYYEDWGMYPPRLDTLRDSEGVSDAVLVCPADSTQGARRSPEIAQGLTRPLSYMMGIPSDWYGAPEFYVFYNIWLPNDPLAGPLALCEHHNPPGTVVTRKRRLGVYADGHVAWCRAYIKDFGGRGMIAWWPFQLDSYEAPEE
jgi:prepilin-type N-terminal cleavage/methylation domain-containing protein